jgi:hypothetical protein
VIVSWTPPTFSSASTVVVPVPVRTIPSRLTVANPFKVNVAEYVPGLSSVIV